MVRERLHLSLCVASLLVPEAAQVDEQAERRLDYHEMDGRECELFLHPDDCAYVSTQTGGVVRVTRQTYGGGSSTNQNREPGWRHALLLL